MTTKTKMLSIRNIVSEMLEDWNIDPKTFDIQNTYGEYLKKFKEGIKALGIEPSILKNSYTGEFEIPETQKEYVKFLLESYTKDPIKALRKGKVDEKHLDELATYISKTEDFLSETMDDESDFEFTRGTLYVLSRYLILSAISALRKTAIAKIVQDMEEMKTALFNKNTVYNGLNDSDRSHLISFYRELLEEASRQWHMVAATVSDIRINELAELSDKEYESGEDYGFPPPMEDVRILIREAILEYHKKGLMTEKQVHLSKPSPVQMKKVAEVLKKEKAKKNSTKSI